MFSLLWMVLVGCEHLQYTMQERNETGLLPGLFYLPWVTAWECGPLILPNTPGTGMFSLLSTLLAQERAAFSQAVGKVGGWFSYAGWSPPYRVRSKPVFIAQQVCYRPKQTTSRSIVTQSHSVTEFREVWLHVLPIDLQRHFRHGDQIVVNELVLVRMLGLSFPQVLLLLLNTISLQLLGSFSSLSLQQGLTQTSFLISTSN